MSNLLIALLVGAGIVGVVLIHGALNARREKKLREVRERMESALAGVTMLAARARNNRSAASPVSSTKTQSSNQSSSSPSMNYTNPSFDTTAVPTMNWGDNDDHHKSTTKFHGGGGTFDGGGASGDWDKPMSHSHSNHDASGHSSHDSSSSSYDSSSSSSDTSSSSYD